MENWRVSEEEKTEWGGLFPLPYLTLPACEWWEKLSFSCIRQKSALLILPPDETGSQGGKEDSKSDNSQRTWAKSMASAIPHHDLLLRLWSPEASAGHWSRRLLRSHSDHHSGGQNQKQTLPFRQQNEVTLLLHIQFPKCSCARAAKSGCDGSKSTLPKPPNVLGFTHSWIPLREEKFTLTFGKLKRGGKINKIISNLFLTTRCPTDQNESGTNVLALKENSF